ncbi:MAG: arginine--tRNA ligase, partial [Bacilli bacterium]|nr:arginine--tRNA ligase [Bacilli bacterium]
MMNIEQNLKDKIVAAASKLGVVLTSNDVIIEKSKAVEHGDYATNVALKNASKVGKNPRQ